MKCHKKNNNKKGIFKYIGMMGICCLAPIIILLLIQILGFSNNSTAKFMPILSTLICPILMGLMFFSMFKSSKVEKEEENKEFTDII